MFEMTQEEERKESLDINLIPKLTPMNFDTKKENLSTYYHSTILGKLFLIGQGMQ